MQSPLVKKIQETVESFKILDKKIKCMVGNLSSVIVFRCSLFRPAKSVIFLSSVGDVNKSTVILCRTIMYSSGSSSHCKNFWMNNQS